MLKPIVPSGRVAALIDVLIALGIGLVEAVPLMST